MNVAGLYRYPVKGLSAERLRSVSLVAGYGFPKDRVYAVTDGSLAFDETNPQPAPKTQFLMLAKHERLAQLHTQFVDAEETLHVRDAQGVTRAYRLDRPEDHDLLAVEFFREDDRAGLAGKALDDALALKGAQMAHRRRLAGEAEIVLKFTGRRHYPRFPLGGLQVLDDLPLALGQPFLHGLCEQCS